MTDDKDKGIEGLVAPSAEEKSIDDIREEQFELFDLAGEQLDPDQVKLLLEDKAACEELMIGVKYQDPTELLVIGVNDQNKLFVMNSRKDLGHILFLMERARQGLFS